jgi:3-oxoacyl-[acyl-carrier protein] reductase
MMSKWNDGKRFTGRAAIVTGASGALGGAIAAAFGKEGANVALSYRNEREAAEKTAAAITALGGSAFAAHLEVTNEESVAAFVSQVMDRFGGVDVLVNAAGRINAADAVHFMDITPDSWRALFEIDVFGSYLMCQAVIPHMVQKGSGAIINFSGSYGTANNKDNPVTSVAVGYCAAKGAIRGFTASLARELAPAVRVNAVSPGPIAADWEEDWEISKEQVGEALGVTPLGRMGQPEEIAETVLFLSSDGGAYITGQVIQVDGGWVLAG